MLPSTRRTLGEHRTEPRGGHHDPDPVRPTGGCDLRRGGELPQARYLRALRSPLTAIYADAVREASLRARIEFEAAMESIPVGLEALAQKERR
jgi:hypothetical protein